MPVGGEIVKLLHHRRHHIPPVQKGDCKDPGTRDGTGTDAATRTAEGAVEGAGEVKDTRTGNLRPRRPMLKPGSPNKCARTPGCNACKKAAAAGCDAGGRGYGPF